MASTRARYRDPGLSVEERATDLLGRMDLDEKIAQLGSVWAFEVAGRDDRLDHDAAAERMAHGIGQITRVAGATNLDAAGVVRLGNEIQRFLIDETRLGIPAVLHEECLHGLLASDAPDFPQSIGAAATFDPTLVEAMATTLRRRMLATGARLGLAPVLDLTRDPRWGRIEETYGEDPVLAATLGAAYIRGLQGPSLADGVAATGKHLVGHGLAEGGLNMAPAHVGPRELRDEQLFPFEVAVREAGLAAIMPAYCDVDGVPCHAAHELLTTILRHEWGFDGVVISDYAGLEMLSTLHRLHPDLAQVAAMALAAGVDAELPGALVFGEHLRRAVHDGRVDERHVDAAVERTLRLKVRLGLFERPLVPAPDPAALVRSRAEEDRIAGVLARRSIVLAENDGILPLAPGLRRIAVIGPLADSARDLIGDYHHLLHIQTLVEAREQDNALGFAVSGDHLQPIDELATRPTILDGIRAVLPDADIRYARGCGLRDGTDAELAAAVDAARSADVAIVVVGERSGLTPDATTGETRDRRDLGLLGRQSELVEAIVATGTPVALVVISGRPLALAWAAEHCSAILLGWVPGGAGPAAIADVLVGAADPGGRLPVTVPRHVGQVPLTYRHHPSGGRSNWRVDYVDGPSSPLWAFGSGRSYTTFALRDLRVDDATVATVDGTLVVRVDIENVGARPGEEVVQLYSRDEAASVARPVLELQAFQRLALAPGERRTVTFELASEQFSYTGADHRRVVEPGRVTIHVGRSAAELPLTVDVDLVGPTIEVVERGRYLTRTSVA